MSSEPSYVTVAKAIAHLSERGFKPTPQTVRRWAKSGKVRSMRMRTGRQFLVCVEDLDALLEPVAVGGAA